MTASYTTVSTKGFEVVTYELETESDLPEIVQDFRDQLASHGESQSTIDLAVALGLFREAA